MVLFLLGGGRLVWSAVQDPEQPDIAADLITSADFELPTFGFAVVDGAYDWEFPRDFGPHPEFQREAWQLETAENCEVSFSVTFERLSVVAEVLAPERSSMWALRDIFTAEAVIDGQRTTRISRNAIGLAGVDETQVWVENWVLDWENGRLSVVADRGELDLAFSLDEPDDAMVEGELYQYARGGQMVDGCEIQLTHGFG